MFLKSSAVVFKDHFYSGSSDQRRLWINGGCGSTWTSVGLLRIHRQRGIYTGLMKSVWCGSDFKGLFRKVFYFQVLEINSTVKLLKGLVNISL